MDMYIYTLSTSAAIDSMTKKIERQEQQQERTRESEGICGFCKVGRREKKKRIRIYIEDRERRERKYR